jgi:hypothetical protein
MWHNDAIFHARLQPVHTTPAERIESARTAGRDTRPDADAGAVPAVTYTTPPTTSATTTTPAGLSPAATGQPSSLRYAAVGRSRTTLDRRGVPIVFAASVHAVNL